MSGQVLLYGATGYTGRLIAAKLAGSSIDVVLGGRNGNKLLPLARELGRPCRVFGLGPGEPIDNALEDIAVVLHAGGPFKQTASPMMAACIRTRTHYLDLAGEWPIFADAMNRSTAASVAGVMLMPGVGFNLVASDCLLALAAARVPDAAMLRLAISRPEIILRGTLRSLLDLTGADVWVRHGGDLRPVPAGHLYRDFDFGDGIRRATAVTWPDVVTGQFTTGIADIETYVEADWMVRLAQQMGAITVPWTNTATGRVMTEVLSHAWPEAPSREAMVRARFVLVVEAADRWRRLTSLRMRTLNGYTVTQIVASEIVRRVLDGEHKPGFRTPASIFGGEFILGLGCASLDTAAA